MVLAFLLGLFFNKFVFTGKAVQEISYLGKSSWTKALCNSENECMDVLITCEQGRVIDIEPASEIKKYPDNWQDIRGNLSENLC